MKFLCGCVSCYLRCNFTFSMKCYNLIYYHTADQQHRDTSKCNTINKQLILIWYCIMKLISFVKSTGHKERKTPVKSAFSSPYYSLGVSKRCSVIPLISQVVHISSESTSFIESRFLQLLTRLQIASFLKSSSAT